MDNSTMSTQVGINMRAHNAEVEQDGAVRINPDCFFHSRELKHLCWEMNQAIDEGDTSAARLYLEQARARVHVLDRDMRTKLHDYGNQIQREILLDYIGREAK